MIMSDSWMQYNSIFYLNSITENQQHYDRKIVQFSQCHFQLSSSITLENGADSVISSSNNVGGGGAFIRGGVY